MQVQKSLKVVQNQLGERIQEVQSAAEADAAAAVVAEEVLRVETQAALAAVVISAAGDVSDRSSHYCRLITQ